LDDSGFDYILYNLFSSAEKPPRIVTYIPKPPTLVFFVLFYVIVAGLFIFIPSIGSAGSSSATSPVSARTLFNDGSRQKHRRSRAQFFFSETMVNALADPPNGRDRRGKSYIAEECKTALGIPEKKDHRRARLFASRSRRIRGNTGRLDLFLWKPYTPLLLPSVPSAFSTTATMPMVWI
jgi:hypothetical protein